MEPYLGDVYRLVLTPNEHARWQDDRYASGLYTAVPLDRVHAKATTVQADRQVLCVDWVMDDRDEGYSLHANAEDVTYYRDRYEAYVTAGYGQEALSMVPLMRTDQEPYLRVVPVPVADALRHALSWRGLRVTRYETERDPCMLLDFQRDAQQQGRPE
jgi:hypothetical protein